MRARRALVIAACSASLIASAGRSDLAARAGQLGGTSPDPDAIPVSGLEQLAWEYQASSASDVSRLGFILTVDGAVGSVGVASCTNVVGAPLVTCRAPLPPMSPGVHTLRVSAYAEGSAPGPPSNPIRVYYQPLWAVSHELATHALTATTADGVQFQASVVATGLVDPTDLLMLPDGRVLIAERGGRVRVLRDGRLLPEPAVVVTDIVIGDGRGLLALAADVEFERTGLVYAVYTASSGARLARFLLARDSLVSQSTLLDGLPLAPMQPAAAIGVGPDFKVYLALDDGGDTGRIDDVGSYSGKVLRLNRDGTTPRDERAPAPVWFGGFARPAGIGLTSGGLWVLGRRAGGSAWLEALAPARGLAAAVRRIAIPPDVNATDIAVYDAAEPTPLHGNVFIASASGGLLRVRPDADTTPEWVFRGLTAPIASIAVARDGAIVVAAGSDLLRICPLTGC